jgi:hypothetical protein
MMVVPARKARAKRKSVGEVSIALYSQAVDGNGSGFGVRWLATAFQNATGIVGRRTGRLE